MKVTRNCGLEKAAKMPEATPKQENWAHSPASRVTRNRVPPARPWQSVPPALKQGVGSP